MVINLRCSPAQKKRWRDELDKILERLDMYYAAEKAILSGAQSYSIGSRQLTRANLNQLLEEISNLENKRDELENALENCISPKKRKAVRVLFRDL